MFKKVYLYFYLGKHPLHTAWWRCEPWWTPEVTYVAKRWRLFSFECVVFSNMSSVQRLQEFISGRLVAAVAEIFSEFESTILRYEEEIDRQRRLLEICWKPEIKLQRLGMWLSNCLRICELTIKGSFR